MIRHSVRRGQSRTLRLPPLHGPSSEGNQLVGNGVLSLKMRTSENGTLGTLLVGAGRRVIPKVTCASPTSYYGLRLRFLHGVIYVT